MGQHDAIERINHMPTTQRVMGHTDMLINNAAMFDVDRQLLIKASPGSIIELGTFSSAKWRITLKLARFLPPLQKSGCQKPSSFELGDKSPW